MSTPRKSYISHQEKINTAALSIFLNIPEATLCKWRSTGEVNLPYIKIGNAVRYDLEDVNQWLKDNTHHKPKNGAKV